MILDAYGLGSSQPVHLWYGKHMFSKGKKLYATRLLESEGDVLEVGEEYISPGGGGFRLYLGKTKLYFARRFAASITGTDLEPSDVLFRWNLFNVF